MKYRLSLLQILGQTNRRDRSYRDTRKKELLLDKNRPFDICCRKL